MENLQDINWIDGIITGALLLSSAWGLFRGLVRGVFGIVSLVASFFLAQKYGGNLGATMNALLGESLVSAVAAYVLVFLLGMLVFGTLTYFLRKAVAVADLGMLDKFGGLFFGAARGAVFGALFVLMLAAFPLQQAAAWRESVMVPFLGGVLNVAADFSFLSGAREYLKFDSQNRPRWTLASGKTAHPKTAAEAEAGLQRDELLDELNDEITEQSLHSNAAAKKNALALKERSRQKSFLQEINIYLKKLTGGLECGEGGCQGEPGAPRPQKDTGGLVCDENGCTNEFDDAYLQKIMGELECGEGDCKEELDAYLQRIADELECGRPGCQENKGE